MFTKAETTNEVCLLMLLVTEHLNVGSLRTLLVALGSVQLVPNFNALVASYLNQCGGPASLHGLHP